MNPGAWRGTEGVVKSLVCLSIGARLRFFADLVEAVDAAGQVPVFDQQVAVVVVGDAVGGVEETFLPRFGRVLVGGPLLRVRVIAERGDNLVRSIDDRDAALE